MQNSLPQNKTRMYIACYALYALLIALTFFVVFMIWPTTILALLATLSGPGSANTAIYNFGMLLLGIFGFIIVMAAEPYLRHGVERQQLLKRFGKITLPILILGAAGLLLRAWSASL